MKADEVAERGGSRGAMVVLMAVCFLYNAALSTTWAPMMLGYQMSACKQLGLPSNCTQTKEVAGGHTNTNGSAGGRQVAGNADAAAAGLAHMGTNALIVNTANFLTISLLAELSDAHGRKLSLLVPILGMALNSACYVWLWSGDLSVFFVLLGVTSLTGGQFSMYSGMFACLADLTTHMTLIRRTKYFGLMNMMLFAGLMLGPYLVGVLMDRGMAPSRTYLISALAGLVLGAVVLCLLPETRTKAKRTPFSLPRANPLGGVWLLASHPVTRAVIAVNIFFILGTVGMMSIMPTWLLNLGFSPLHADLYQSSTFGALAVGNMVLVEPIVNALGIPYAVGLSGLLLAVFMCWFGLVPVVWPGVVVAPWVIYLMCAPICLGAAWDSACRSLSVTIHGEANYGLTVAGIASIQCLLQGVTGKASAWVLSYGDATGRPWLVFAACSACILGGVGCSAAMHPGCMHARAGAAPQRGSLQEPINH